MISSIFGKSFHFPFPYFCIIRTLVLLSTRTGLFQVDVVAVTLFIHFALSIFPFIDKLTAVSDLWHNVKGKPREVK